MPPGPVTVNLGQGLGVWGLGSGAWGVPLGPRHPGVRREWAADRRKGGAPPARLP